MQTQTYPETYFKVFAYDKYGDSRTEGLYETLEEAINAGEKAMEFTYDRDTGYWEPREGSEDRVWIEQIIIVDEDSSPITREKCLTRWYEEVA